MTKAKIAAAVLAYLVIVPTTSMTQGEDKAPKEKWIQLFNGKDLTGWKVKITGQVQEAPHDG